MQELYTFSDRLYRSRVVQIGKLFLGGDHPVRVQSMTNTPTLDTAATVDQCLRLAEAGSEMIRITAPGVREARHLEVIKNQLISRNIDIPLIADIHFQPAAAEVAATIVEKVRINPGNYTGKTAGIGSEAAYDDELKRVRERMFPLLEICRKHRTVIRIGTNHGSLSERIIQRYGNTPEGMVESALEFARICRELYFQDLVLSMKASDVRVMIYATRLLVQRMKEENMDYPLHLGVTEAGDAWDGRIRSAAGIGALLADGIGDTIRVSLTEAPEKEIPVALKIIDPITGIRQMKVATRGQVTGFRHSGLIHNGYSGVPMVVGKGMAASGETSAPDILDADNNTLIYNGKSYRIKRLKDLEDEVTKDDITFVSFDAGELEAFLPEGKTFSGNAILIARAQGENARRQFGLIQKQLTKHSIPNMVILKYSCQEPDNDTCHYLASAVMAASLADGFGNGLWLDLPVRFDPAKASDTAFSLLQFLHLRITKTEFIACPSCGRTMFDIESVLKQVKEKTRHLTGLKIAVMGCIVNGPGEMADADYGYVGAGKGMVNLYYRREVVKRGIPEEKALEELILLIKDKGDWK
ncbi:MAG: (E)-4-hydroxy-3-methylbut-2-enyl-diphosphate synthase [Bacteroidetes bacterium]|nr:(E)-4-hydroxy-3-methylbut-2-enyl-diphosphate synthase [Bacteroidota bacterium]